MAPRARLAGDASARRYERLTLTGRGIAVLMDAPPESGQDTGAFVRIADWLRSQGLSAPKILAADTANGLLLLEDFGDAVFGRLAAGSPEVELGLYRAAGEMLITLQGCAVPDWVPHPTPADLSSLIGPVFDWYAAPLGVEVEQRRKSEILAELESLLTQTAPSRPVLSLRDCHAENLIWLPDRTGVARVGLLDFQDAFAVHPAYDFVSLIQDARRDVPAAVSDALLSGFDDDFRMAFAVLGVQRNLRILGIFGRLSLSAGKPGYVSLIPRVWGHLQTSLGHPALRKLAVLLQGLPDPFQTSLTLLDPHDPA